MLISRSLIGQFLLVKHFGFFADPKVPFRTFAAGIFSLTQPESLKMLQFFSLNSFLQLQGEKSYDAFSKGSLQTRKRYRRRRGWLFLIVA